MKNKRKYSCDNFQYSKRSPYQGARPQFTTRLSAYPGGTDALCTSSAKLQSLSCRNWHNQWTLPTDSISMNYFNESTCQKFPHTDPPLIWSTPVTFQAHLTVSSSIDFLHIFHLLIDLISIWNLYKIELIFQIKNKTIQLEKFHVPKWLFWNQELNYCG